MEQILQIREITINFYKRYEIIIMFLLKLIIGLVIYSRINDIGYAREEFFKLTKSSMLLPYTILMGVLFAVLPITASYVLIIVNITMQLSAVLEMAVIVFLALLAVLLLYARLAPKESVLILATIIASYFNLPYIVPLAAGLYFSMASVAPVAIGVFIWEYIPVVMRLMDTSETAGLNISDMPASFSQIYVSLVNSMAVNQEWIFTAFIFAMVIVTVYAVSRLSVDYSRDLAIGLGSVLNIVSFIIAVIVADLEVGIFSVLIFSILSGLIMEAVRFFDIVLDYQRAERVTFEDDENEYYVKVVPKMTLSRRKRVLRRIRPHDED